MSSAKITIWDTIVGYIVWDDSNQTAIFESDESYLKAGFSISPLLHTDKKEIINGSDYKKKFNGLFPCFHDSLPDSFGNMVFKEWLLQNKIDQSHLNPVERLLYVGKRGVGALEYHKGYEIPNVVHSIDLNELAGISDTILKRKYDQRDFLHNPEALKNILVIGSSFGGAQAKVLVGINAKNELLAGDVIHDDEVDYYIVKLEHDSIQAWYKEKNFIEYEYNQIAREIGINVAESHLLTQDGKTHFASKRFDRQNNQKLHTQTVNALTGFYGRNTEFSYEDIFRIINYLGLPYRNVEQLFMQMVFNVAASNRDDHTKNFSFIMDKLGQWSLSPAYDLTYPFDPYQSFYTPHQISINGKTKDINRFDLEAVAKKVGVRNYNQLIDLVIDRLATFDVRINQYGLNNKTIQLLAKEIESNRKRIQR
jgi:serine/threonine-protein kinase HipA